MNLDDFSERMEDLAGRVTKGRATALRQVALAVDQAEVLATPVDTGEARSNWVMSIGSPVTNMIGPYVPGERLGVEETANALAAITQASAIVSSVRPGDTIYLSNNASHMLYLNRDGISPQANAGFVQDAIRDALASFSGKFTIITEGLS